jgi:dihydrofolate reductase
MSVFFDAGISLDGFIAGDNRGPSNPLGDHGPTIHQWMYQQKAFWRYLGQAGGTEDGPEGALIEEPVRRTGAYVMGKRMFDEGEANWPEDLYKAPVYVVTHEKRDPWVQRGSTVFYFVNNGIESALQQAKDAAKGKDVRIQGGGAIIQQYLNSGLVDEFTVHVAPVVIGSGVRLFDNLDRRRVSVEIVETVPSRLATHIRYKVRAKKPLE